MKKQTGFSLIELLIVIVVIGILAAIGVPDLLSSRRAANEASALRSVRVMSSAEIAYQGTTGNGEFGTANQLYALGLIDANVGAANNVNVGGTPATNTPKSGYRFRIQITARDPAAPATFVVSAIPATTSGVTQTGTKRLCLTENGAMKSSTAALGTHYSYANCDIATTFRP